MKWYEDAPEQMRLLNACGLVALLKEALEERKVRQIAAQVMADREYRLQKDLELARKEADALRAEVAAQKAQLAAIAQPLSEEEVRQMRMYGTAVRYVDKP